jgi:hypothetical protein
MDLLKNGGVGEVSEGADEGRLNDETRLVEEEGGGHAIGLPVAVAVGR